MIIEEYRRSLKLPQAEELFDLVFYRPAAYLLVKAVYRTPITPNQVTLLSLASALVASWLFALGSLDALAAAAGWYAASNILDCADGQLARLQKSGTPHGRIVDGVADYVGTVAIFLGIGTGFSNLGMNLWPLVIAAGLSSALHAMLFDHRQGAYIAAARGEPDFHAGERKKFSAVPVTPAAPGTPETADRSPLAYVVRLYLAYMRVQTRLIERLTRPPDGRPYDVGKNTPLIRLWSFLGPTTNRTALIAFALVGRVDLFLWGVVIAGNAWLISLIFLQKQMDAGAARGTAAPADADDTR